MAVKYECDRCGMQHKFADVLTLMTTSESSRQMLEFGFTLRHLCKRCCEEVSEKITSEGEGLRFGRRLEMALADLMMAHTANDRVEAMNHLRAELGLRLTAAWRHVPVKEW